jgi:hypothetical protein
MKIPTASALAQYAWVFGLLALVAVWAVCGIFAKWDIRKWWCGADGKPSTSKFQLLLWTAVVLFVYTTIAAKFFLLGKTIITDPKCGTFPSNILVVLGLSGATAAVAKGITVGYLNSGRLIKTPDGNGGGVLTSDEGGPDLSKLQITAWTCVAIIIYIIQFARIFPHLPTSRADAPGCDVPDIDTTLMVLMGLSQGAYVGKKLVTMDTPRIFQLTPLHGPTGTVITMQGASFGEAQDGSAVLIDGQVTPVTTTTWSDAQMTFAMPTSSSTGIPLSMGPHAVSLIVAGRASAGSATFTLTPPTVTGIMPGKAKAGDTVTLYGFFGGAQPTSNVLMDGMPIAGTATWTQDTITFVVPAQHPNGTAWQQHDVQISVRVSNITSNSLPLTI